MKDRQTALPVIQDGESNQKIKLINHMMISYFNDVGIKFVGSTVVGVVLAGLFSPVDRALYLAQNTGRNFFLKANFIRPFEGFRTAIFQRTISGGSYFFLQGLVETSLSSFLGRSEAGTHYLEKIGVGFCAGMLNGIMMNPLSAIKSNMWSESERIRALKTDLSVDADKFHKNCLIKQRVGFFRMASTMWQSGGFSPFHRGLTAMLWRETHFAIPYELTRYGLRLHLYDNDHAMNNFAYGVVSDSIGAGVGAIVASVPNYVRNLQYHVPLNKDPHSIIECLITFNNKVMQAEYKFLTLRQMLCLGPGTARVAIGTALGQGLFKIVVDGMKDVQKNIFEKHDGSIKNAKPNF